MALGDEIIIGTSINNTMGITGKAMADKINKYFDHGVAIFRLVITPSDQMRKIAEEVLPHVKRDPPAGARGGTVAT